MISCIVLDIGSIFCIILAAIAVLAILFYLFVLAISIGVEKGISRYLLLHSKKDLNNDNGSIDNIDNNYNQN